MSRISGSATACLSYLVFVKASEFGEKETLHKMEFSKLSLIKSDAAKRKAEPSGGGSPKRRKDKEEAEALYGPLAHVLD